MGSRSLACLLVLLMGFASFSTASPWKISVRAAEEYVYYGYVPENITGTGPPATAGGPLQQWPVDHGLLIILGNEDGTRVKVYRLPEKRLLEEFSVNKMGNVTLSLPNATFFRVSSDNPVSVTLVGGGNLERVEAMISTFFTGTEGGYIGREFIFPSVQSKTMTFAWRVYAVIPGLPFKIYALEESDVQVWEANGEKVFEFHLAQNKFREFQPKPFRAYRLTSTGNVMLQTFTRDSPSFYPAVQGGFVGTLFYGTCVPKELWTIAEWWTGNLAFIATSTENAKLTPVNLEYDRKLDSVEVPAETNDSFKLEANHIAIKSDRPILFMYKSDDSMGGVASMGLKAGQTAYLVVPLGYTYAFAYKETVVNVDDVTVRLQPDGILPITQGVHRLATSENLLVQVTNIAKDVATNTFVGINAFGACLPSAQSLDITYQGLKLKSVVSEELPWAYIGGAATAVAVVAVLYFAKRKRSGVA